MSRVLIFGATGYVGGHLAGRLVRDGHAVTAIVRSSAAADSCRARGFASLVDDARHMAIDTAFVAPFDTVIWAAQLMLEEERRVCADLLKAILGTGKAFLFTSGTSLLSEPTQGDWSENSFAEDDIFVPRRQVAPRLEIENMVRAAASHGVRAMVVRPPLIWGHGGCRIIADLYHSARACGAVCHVGRGLNLYTHVHVDDLCDLYARAMATGVAGALYHAASGETDFRTMAATIARHLGIATRSVSIEEASQIWDRFMGPIVFSGCSRTRAPRSRAELGWRPSPDRADVLTECVMPSYAAAAERAPPSWVRQP